ncbi:TPA: hypothetical protein ACGFA2_001914 [Serratia marcescens]|uniref:hypothetical protein n=1 Tax=Serratia TaxID=613 RepID=UPI002DB73D32|nr:hypothetical protein [Serratia marcescens]MEB7509108.1 hypothetical protein [Serratia marcescens]
MMIIEIINTEGVNLHAEPVHSAISNLFTSFKEGKHILIASSEFLENIINDEKFGILIRNSASSALARLRENRSLFNKVNYHCKTDLSIPYSLPHKKNGEGFFTVGCNFFHDSLSTQCARLLCEDIRDYQLYTIIASHFKKTQNLDNMHISLEIINGGGANTKLNFDKITAKGLLCLCILDSDKKHPSAGYGDTSKKFAGNTPPAHSKHLILDSHEIESLIPMNTIKIALEEKKLEEKYNKSFDSLDSIVKFNPEAKKYFDHKEGLTVNNAVILDERYQRNFWTDCIKKAPGLKRKKCLTTLECTCKKPCFAINGFGNGFLGAVLPVIEKTSFHKLDRQLTEQIKKEWTTIGVSLFSWGCSSGKKIRSS